MNLSPKELGELTPAEYLAKVQGFRDFYQQQQKDRQVLALYQAWHEAYLIHFAIHDPKKMPKLDTLLRSIKD